MAEVPRVAKLGHAWLQDQVVMPRVAKESHAWLSLATPWRNDHAWLCFFSFFGVLRPCVTRGSDISPRQ